MQRLTNAESRMPLTLQDLRENYRPLLVFAGNGRDSKLQEQMHLLSGAASELRERQIRIVPLVGDGDTGAFATALDPALTAHLSAEEAAAARKRFRAAPSDFTIILIGKDGGEKLRAHNPVTIKELNTVIDAMPMRQQEVRNGHAN